MSITLTAQSPIAEQTYEYHSTNQYGGNGMMSNEDFLSNSRTIADWLSVNHPKDADGNSKFSVACFQVVASLANNPCDILDNFSVTPAALPSVQTNYNVTFTITDSDLNTQFKKEWL